MFQTNYVVFRYALALILWTGVESVAAPLGTAFTYQGQLKEGGAPANGFYDFRFTLFSPDVPSAVPPVCVVNVEVINGLFTVDIKFPLNEFDGKSLAVHVDVSPTRVFDCVSNTLPDPFTRLVPPQLLTPTPYAIHALSAPNAHALNAVDGDPVNALFVGPTGDVGIGTTTPAAKLHVNGAVRADGFTSFDPDGTQVFDVALSGVLTMREGDGTTTVALRAGDTVGGGAALRMNNSAGVQTVRLDADDADAAVFVLTNAAGLNTVVLDAEAASPGGGRVSVRNNTGRETVEIDADESDAAVLRLSRASGGATISMGASTSEIILADAQGDAGIVLDGEHFPTDAHAGGHISVRDDVGRERVEIDGDDESSDGRGAFIAVRNENGTSRIILGGASGRVTCVDLVETSTRSMKNDIRPIVDAFARLIRLQGVEFTWDECVGGRRDIGLIAEDVAEVLPELVRFEEDGVTAKGMNYTHLTALIVEAIKELDAKVRTKEAEIAELEGRMTRLETALLQSRKGE